ncbi:MAG: Gfo/Idh/MocA family oxidoreductase, partial [Desulfoferrobacter sp.]
PFRIHRLLTKFLHPLHSFLTFFPSHLISSSPSDPQSFSPSQLLMVGYNRRFAPLSRILKDKLRHGPFSMMYRVNAGSISPDSWIQDREIGGGRILGEVCHFVDYLTFLNGSLPVLVQAVAMDDPFHHQDTLSVSIRYKNGSIGSIQYFANGSKELPKEYLEVHSHGVTAILRDFRELQIHSKGRPFKKKLLTQDKGQKEEVRQFIEAVRHGKEAPISLDEIFSTSYTCFAILESLSTRTSVRLDYDFHHGGTEVDPSFPGREMAGKGNPKA